MTNNVTRITPGLIDSREVRSVNQDKTYTYYPNIDYMYGPYNSLEEAYAALSKETDNIGATALVKGKTVGVIEGGKILEYWFESDPADTTAGYKITDLVKKNSEQPHTDVIELSNYTNNGKVLPLSGAYTYNGNPVSHIRVISETDGVQYIFCPRHNNNYESETYFVFYDDEYDEIDGPVYAGSYTHDNAPDWIQKAMGENLASGSYAGLMSETDKNRLDEMWTWYQTQNSASTTNA